MQVGHGHALRRRAGQSRADAPVARAVPRADQVVVEREQFPRVLDGRGIHARLEGGRQQVGEERVFLVFDDVGLVDRDARPHADVAIGGADAVDARHGRDRHMERVVHHAGDAELHHLERAHQRAQIGEAALVHLGRERRHLVEHEHFERQPVERASHQVRRRMEMRVDEARHRQHPARVDHLVAGQDRQVRPHRRDAAILDPEIEPLHADPCCVDEKRVRTLDQFSHSTLIPCRRMPVPSGVMEARLKPADTATGYCQRSRPARYRPGWPIARTWASDRRLVCFSLSSTMAERTCATEGCARKTSASSRERSRSVGTDSLTR